MKSPSDKWEVSNLLLRVRLHRLFWTEFIRFVVLAGAMGCCADVAWAVLGKVPSAAPATASTTTPTRRLAATSAPRSGLYTVQEVLLETGTSVQEFTNAAGVVFAVVWRGPVLPDLSVLLGDYFTTFKIEMEQARAQGKRGSPASVAHDKLVVRSAGRMRNFSGYAYAPELIPVGVNISDVLQ